MDWLSNKGLKVKCSMHKRIESEASEHKGIKSNISGSKLTQVFRKLNYFRCENYCILVVFSPLVNVLLFLD